MLHMARAMHRWHPVELSYITETNCGDKRVMMVDLEKLTAAKKKPESVRSFVDTLAELDASRLRFEAMDSGETSGWEGSKGKEEEEEDMIESMERIADEDKERTKEAEPHIRLQKKCMELCVHLVSHPFKQVCVISFFKGMKLCWRLSKLKITPSPSGETKIQEC